MPILHGQGSAGLEVGKSETVRWKKERRNRSVADDVNLSLRGCYLKQVDSRLIGNKLTYPSSPLPSLMNHSLRV